MNELMKTLETNNTTTIKNTTQDIMNNGYAAELLISQVQKKTQCKYKGKVSFILMNYYLYSIF